MLVYTVSATTAARMDQFHLRLADRLRDNTRQMRIRNNCQSEDYAAIFSYYDIYFPIFMGFDYNLFKREISHVYCNRFPN